ncbi:MAG: diadenylate cyclase [Minisyncoccia bacterium]
MTSHMLLGAISLVSNFSFSWLSLRDGIDVVVIAILIYVGLRLLLETHSWPMLVGVLAVALLYGASSLFNLPLTHLVLSAFFGFFIIFIAIIFQKELRRLLSFVGFFSFKRTAPPADGTILTISQAAGILSKNKVGALIVFPGKEPIGRFLEGGIALRGEISKELLLSLFSEETPGHDGAMIIENNRIKKFGVHLPLTENIAHNAQFHGLRHRAALGLSEQSDALVLVVSGETGSVDIAQDGEWTHCANEHDLHEKLAEFSSEFSLPRTALATFPGWLWQNAGLFAASLVIAAGTWLFFSANFAPAQKDFTAPLEFQNIPSGYFVEDVIPRDAVVTLNGQDSDFNTLNPQALNVSVNIGSSTTAGWRTIALTTKDVNAPLNFSVIQVKPQSIQIEMVKD